MNKQKITIVGLGSRAAMYARAVQGRYADRAELVGLCDVNPGRTALYNRELGTHVPTFTDIDEMLNGCDADTLVVASKDSTHHEFILKGFAHGLRVITEKPMTVNAGNCKAILQAEANAPHPLRMCFNYRYSPPHTEIKKILMSGAIGDIVSADFNYYLDTFHGADYFRRWHRRKENSGGLAVHKATHHFDLLNWWLDQDPTEVFASGSLAFYGPTRPERGERCRTCAHTHTCEFFMDVGQNDNLKKLYQDQEQHDGYFRDRCVFDPEINIEDNISASIVYTKGARVSYSLLAFAAYEGFRVAFNGTKGRLEAFIPHTVPWPSEGVDLWLTPSRQPRQIIHVPEPEDAGGHWGGDTVMLDDIFLPNRPDPYGRVAGSHAGAMSILTGIACNEAMRTGKPVQVSELLS
jgi:predicted dehydrogenase